MIVIVMLCIMQQNKQLLLVATIVKEVGTS